LKKLIFIALAVVLALSIGLVGCGGGGDECPTSWNTTVALAMHLTVPNKFVSLASKVYIPWADEVMNHTGSEGGTFNITITYGSSPFGAEDSLGGISTNLADIGQLSGDTFDLGSIGLLPFMYPNLTSAAYTGYTIFHDEVATWDKLLQLRDVVVLLVSPLHGANWVSDDYNVTAPGEIAGLAVRAEGNEVDTIQVLNATAVTNIAINDVAGKISGGDIDGAFVTYSAMMSFGIVNVINYTTQMCGLFPRMYSLAINKDVYDCLAPEAKAWLDNCTTLQKSVDYAVLHADSEGYYKTQVTNNLSAAGKNPIYECTGTCCDAWETATAGVKTTWAADMNTLGYNGTGLLARVEALVAAAP